MYLYSSISVAWPKISDDRSEVLAKGHYTSEPGLGKGSLLSQVLARFTTLLSKVLVRVHF